MKSQKINNLDIIPPSQESGAFITKPDLPRSHMINITTGKRNSGKTVAIVNLIEKIGYDYTILVSPTASSNKELVERLNVEHVFDDVDDLTVIDKIKTIIEGEAQDLERYNKEMERYNEFMKKLKKGEYIPDSELLLFYSDDGKFMKPTHRFNGRKPHIATFFDDALGSIIYSRPRKLNALSTYSRHIGQLSEGGSIGVSLFFAIQSYKARVGGLTPTIRNQATNMIVFKTKDEKELDDIASSVSGEVDKDTFLKVYDYAIGDGENHEFLFIDLHKKPEQASMFRKRLDEYIIVE